MVAEPTPGQKRERLAVLYALSVIAGAAFPRVAYLLLWPSRLGPRATLLYLAARFAEGYGAPGVPGAPSPALGRADAG